MSASPQILVVDDDAAHLAMLATLLRDWGFMPLLYEDGSSALEYCEKNTGLPQFPDLALVDMRMPKMNGNETLMKLLKLKPDLPVVIMTAFSDVPDAVEAMRNGAADYLLKPLDFGALENLLRKLLASSQGEKPYAQEDNGKNILWGESPAMQKLKKLVATIAPSEANALIDGESGCGKELVARAIHKASKRANGPFVAVNCGAFTESLLASELFGHEKGAFTGADKKHEGLFMEATGGSIFLDEIGEMPPGMQVKLLRVLQEREVLSVGGTKPRKIDCRIIAATNKDLHAETLKGNFREDLYYRLNVVSLHLPPLRERKEDIPLLAEHFAKRFARENHRGFSGINSVALAALRAWPWPGNARELENVMERAVILMHGEQIGLHELPENILANAAAASSPPIPASSPDNTPEVPEIKGAGENQEQGAPLTLAEVERNVIMETLKRTGNNKTETARLLGITRKTLHSKLNRYAEDGEARDI